MPTVFVKIPKGSFPGASRAVLDRQINAAAARAEQIPDDPRKRFSTWVLIEEADTGSWTCGSHDLSAQLLPCIALVYVPAGVLDATSRAQFVQLMHAAFKEALPPQETRQLATSVVLHDVPDGTWGVNGGLWKLPDFARTSGYAHLQHLVPAH